MRRREFLKTTAATGLATPVLSAQSQLPKRPYKDKVELSIIGFGGIIMPGTEPCQRCCGRCRLARRQLFRRGTLLR